MYHDENRPENFPPDGRFQPPVPVAPVTLLLSEAIDQVTQKIYDCQYALDVLKKDAERAKKLLSATPEERLETWFHEALQTNKTFKTAENILNAAHEDRVWLENLLKDEPHTNKAEISRLFEKKWLAEKWADFAAMGMKLSKASIDPAFIEAFVKEKEESFTTKINPELKNSLAVYNLAKQEKETWHQTRRLLFAIQRNVAHIDPYKQIIRFSNFQDIGKTLTETQQAHKKSQETAASTVQGLGCLLGRFFRTSNQYVMIAADYNDLQLEQEIAGELVRLVLQIDAMPDGTKTLDRHYKASAEKARKLAENLSLENAFKAPSAQKLGPQP